MAKKKFCPQINNDCVGKRCAQWKLCHDEASTLGNDPFDVEAQRLYMLYQLNELLTDSSVDEEYKKRIKKLIDIDKDEQVKVKLLQLETELYKPRRKTKV